MPSPSPRAVLLAASALVGACGEAPQDLPPSAQPEIVEALRGDLELERHPADGGGRAWLEGGGEPVQAGGLGRWRIIYEAGPLGIAEGGRLYLQVSPFWGWSTPQVVSADSPGHTTVSTQAEGVELEASTLDQQLLGVRIGGRSLEEGERIEIVYGAGAAGARSDRFAESESRFWIAVDGDGDGVRGLIGDSPSVSVVAGPPAILALTLPSTARPGDLVELTVAVLDRGGNAGVEIEGPIGLRSVGDGLSLAARVVLRPENKGLIKVPVEVLAEGVHRIEGEGPAELRAVSNPLLAERNGARILWGDLHGHSGLSDGTGTPADYLDYALEAAGLDAVALTDHDHWGMEALALHPELWEEIRRETAASNRPGEFITLLGYEWTSWLHGHRHVLYFEDRGSVLSAVDPAYETPAQLWAALRGHPALTFAHHSAGGPIATNWDFPPDPELEPVTEIASVHGSSEAPDSPRLIYSPLPGNFVRDVLDRGHRLGFIGSGDGHDGHPGLAHIASGVGGLAAILSEELTRDGILEAMRSRRVYATNGPRIVLRATLDGREMGQAVPTHGSGRQELAVRVVSPTPLERIDLIRSGGILESISGDGETDLAFERMLPALREGEYLYVRAVQEDRGAAWSSPFFGE